MKQIVLVTGGTGFLGAHSIVQLVRVGYRVRTTVRSLARERDVRALVKDGGVDVDAEDLSFSVADLTATPAGSMRRRAVTSSYTSHRRFRRSFKLDVAAGITL